MSRRNGRVIAFQALYSWDASRVPLEELLAFSWLQKDDELRSDKPAAEPSETAKEERTFASLLIAGAIEHIEEIDKLRQLPSRVIICLLPGQWNELIR